MNNFTEILNFPKYFKACNGQMDYGTHGPELKDDNLYISIFHYLEFIGQAPSKFDTFNLGKWLTESSDKDILSCKYACQSFSINKFNLVLLQQLENKFNEFLK